MDAKSETEKLFSRRKTHRLVLKNGNCNITQYSSKCGQLRSFAKVIKWINASWFSTVNFFAAILSISWLCFGIAYYIICYAHGDLEEEHLPDNQKKNGFKPCIYHINDFSSCLLFSIETQHTVGYGIKGLMAAIIFAKMTLPKLRSNTLLFSKQAVICCRNDSLCLMFRIGDIRKNHLINAKIRAFYIRSTQTIEGEMLYHQQNELELKVDDCKNGLFFNWPLIVVHEIGKDSPLYHYSPSDFFHQRFEIVVVLEGMISSTGQMTQTRASYVGNEIVWGSKFQELLSFNYDRKEFEVDFSKFDQLVGVTTPLCSAASIDESQESLNGQTPYNSLLDVSQNHSISIELVFNNNQQNAT